MENKGKCITNVFAASQGDYSYRMFKGKKVYLHREALEKKLGRVLEEGMLTLHTCGNKNCINPEHLYEGNYKEMASQRVLRGTSSVGLDRPMPKLTEKTAYSALCRLEEGESGTSIASVFGVNPSQITRLKKRPVLEPCS